MHGRVASHTRAIRALCAGAVAMLLATATHAQSDVSIDVSAFGALRLYRPGDVTGLRAKLTSKAQEPLECLLQWDVENADGDMVSHVRPLTLAPNQPLEAWVYARTRPMREAKAMAGDFFTLRVFQSRGGSRVRQLAERTFRPTDAAEQSVPVGISQGAIAILGDDRMGLETLEATLDGVDVPSMQELTQVMPGSRASDLPDRWEGLASLETIVWRRDGPQSLGADAARALRHWIERGGHLVIVAPDTGDPWSLRAGSAGHALADWLPSRPATRVEGLPVSSLLPVLSKGSELRRRDATVSPLLFTPSQLDRGWVPLLTVPGDAKPREAQGLALVVQRAVEHGRISIVGLDLETLHRAALSPDGLPQADVFWNRVLGRRADAPTDSQYHAWDEAKPSRLVGRRSDVVRFDAGNDQLVLGFIGQTGRAAGGVLAVMAYFAGYWLLAVPGCWALLRLRGALRWSWPAFTLVALAAIPVAWLLGSLVGGTSRAVQHLSVVDWRLPGPDDDAGTAGRLRANAWISASLGGFGTAEIRLGDEPSRTDLLMDWSPPPEGPRSRFPDTARSDREVDHPSALACAARATSTELQAWWLGAPPAAWKRVAWAEVQPQTVVLPGATPRVSIRGTLRHELPGPLRDVTIAHVTPWLYETRRLSGSNPQRIEPSDWPCRPTRLMELSGPWDGGPLDLERVLYPDGPAAVSGGDRGSLVHDLNEKFRDPLANSGSALARTGVVDPFGASGSTQQLRMLSMYQLLPPPTYMRTTGPNAPDPTVVRVQRQLGREIDLSAWSARPCVIVTGFLDAAPCPVPLRIGGREPDSAGTVMVRIVVPLGGPLQGEVPPPTIHAVP